MLERIQKIISARGVCSRREAERLIADGRVAVNGVTAALGQSADGVTDALTIDGAPQPAASDTAVCLPRSSFAVVTTPRGLLSMMYTRASTPSGGSIWTPTDCCC